jgi:succinoglycan biosynthesis transport protein ExoP
MADDFEEKPGEKFNPQQFREIIRRRHWYFLIPLFAGWAVVWGASWILPSVYRSGTLILVEQPTVPQQYVVPNITGNLQDRLQSITQQILSRTRLLHIIESLNLYAGDRQKVAPDDLVERMRKDIEIELVHGQGREELTAFNVYFSAGNPYTAQQVTSALTNLFISENLEERQQQSEDTTKFLQTQLEEARKSLSEQEQKVREFKDQHLGELPGQLQSNLQILSGLQTQLQAEEDALNTAKQQGVYLQSLIGQYNALQRSPKTADGAPVGLPALNAELEKLRAQLADLSSHYTDRHPDVRKVKEQIAKTEKMKQQMIAALKAQPTSAAASTDDGEMKSEPTLQLQSQLQANKLEITNRGKSIRELQGRIAGYQAHLNQEPVREQQLTDLTRGYEQSKANYDELLKKKNDSELATSMELRQQGEHFRILDPPSLPIKPYSPDRLKWCGIALLAGLGLGVAFTAAAEFLDDRLYSEQELKDLVGLSILAEIPSVATAKEETRQQHRAWLEWASAGLVFAVILAGSAVSYLRG